jgi:subtilisin family serine protease
MNRWWQLASALALVVAATVRAAEGVPAAAPASTPTRAAPAQLLLLLRMPPAHLRLGDAYGGNYDESAARRARARVAEAIGREHGLRVVGDWPIPAAQVDCFVMELDAGGPDALEGVLNALARDPRIDWAQPMNSYRALGHNDPLFPVQPAAAAWHLAQLHESATGQGVRVAVVDSGVELDHPDLAGQVSTAENFVDGQAYAAERHGTAVAGIIAARADDGVGIAGVAPQARLLALRACWQQAGSDTLCSTLTLAKALQFAIHNDAQVVNMSLSGPSDRLLGRLIDVALARHIAVVGAWDGDAVDGGFPASHKGVWAVSDRRIGRPVVAAPLLAPGGDIPSAAVGAGWQLVNGASYAAAHVAGLLALVHELRARGPQPRAGAAIVSNASGEIDACATLSRAAGEGCSCNCATAAIPVLAPAR